MAAKLSDAERDQGARIVALFSVLIHAWLCNDFAEAGRVIADLEKLGVSVRICRRRNQRKEGGRAN